MTNDTLKSLLSNNKEAYFKNTFEQMVFHFVPAKDPADSKVFAKTKGGEEFEVKDGSTTFADARLEGTIITQEEYDNY